MTIGTWSLEALQVLGLFRDGARMHGYAVVQETGLAIGTVYPILYRFEKEGLLSKAPERVDPHLSQRSPRMIYRGTTVAADQIKVLRELVG